MRALLRDLGSMVEDELRTVSRDSVDLLTGLSNRAGFTLGALRMLSMDARRGHTATLLHLTLSDQEERPADDAMRASSDQLLATFDDADVIGRVDDLAFAVLSSQPMDAPDRVAALHQRVINSALLGLQIHWADVVFDPHRADSLAALMARAELAPQDTLQAS